jgi:hypothetical protein
MYAGYPGNAGFCVDTSIVDAEGYVLKCENGYHLGDTTDEYGFQIAASAFRYSK